MRSRIAAVRSASDCSAGRAAHAATPYDGCPDIRGFSPGSWLGGCSAGANPGGSDGDPHAKAFCCCCCWCGCGVVVLADAGVAVVVISLVKSRLRAAMAGVLETALAKSTMAAAVGVGTGRHIASRQQFRNGEGLAIQMSD